MAQREQLYDGKAKTLFVGPEPDTLIQYFKDDATAFNALKHDVIAGKGVLNNIISEYIMGRVADRGVPTHFIKRMNSREQLVRKVSIIPVEVVVRNVAAGSLVKRLGGKIIPVKDGDILSEPLLEYYLKEDALNDPIISREHLLTFGIASAEELDTIVSLTNKVNAILGELFLGIGIRLIDFKLEFGRLGDEGTILLADEISPDNCRLWDLQTGEKKDKDRFRQDLGGLIEAYEDIARRFGLDLSLLEEKED
ncbi:MAG: phosphoribosylaminoimidazolesuccinocarboxamide synthase [Alphaproteobacteria bacterium]|nr:phosphoribosylaminoimidazolesuccinocarboxamide synthase [Alphaproteobacteria bacterium]